MHREPRISFSAFSPLQSHGLGALQLVIGESQLFGGGVETEDPAAFGAAGHCQVFDRVPALAALQGNGRFFSATISPDAMAKPHNHRYQHEQRKQREEYLGRACHDRICIVALRCDNSGIASFFHFA